MCLLADNVSEGLGFDEGAVISSWMPIRGLARRHRRPTCCYPAIVNNTCLIDYVAGEVFSGAHNFRLTIKLYDYAVSNECLCIVILVVAVTNAFGCSICHI